MQHDISTLKQTSTDDGRMSSPSERFKKLARWGAGGRFVPPVLGGGERFGVHHFVVVVNEYRLYAAIEHTILQQLCHLIVSLWSTWVQYLSFYIPWLR